MQWIYNMAQAPNTALSLPGEIQYFLDKVISQYRSCKLPNMSVADFLVSSSKRRQETSERATIFSSTRKDCQRIIFNPWLRGNIFR